MNSNRSGSPVLNLSRQSNMRSKLEVIEETPRSSRSSSPSSQENDQEDPIDLDTLLQKSANKQQKTSQGMMSASPDCVVMQEENIRSQTYTLQKDTY
jgi:hypothetical protein